MSHDPLALPVDDRLLRRFLDHFRLVLADEPPRRIEQLATAFSRLPYENLSKIVRLAECGVPSAAREMPCDVIEGFIRHGTGGTCFSLTATLLHLLRTLGFRAEPILADRSYGPDTHCALLVWVDESARLIDPGFLLVRPLPLPTVAAQSIATAFHDVVLVPRDRGSRVELWTAGSGRPRLTFKTSPVDHGQFLRAWDASFGWDMMHYPVLTRIVGGQQWYLRANYQQIRDRQGVVREELPDADLPAHIAESYGIDREIVGQAWAILKRDRSALR